MAAYTGKFVYLDAHGAALDQGACEISFDENAGVITPAAGIPIAFDLGDIDVFTPADWDLTLELFTGNRIQLRQFGGAFENLRRDLLAAWRERTLRCLMLEDLAELARFTGVVNGTSAEVRVFESNLAVLPLGGRCTQWRLAEIDSFKFDEAAYGFQAHSGAGKLTISKLGAKTQEFGDQLQGALASLRRRAAEVLHQTFPFLNPDELRRLIALAPEGRSVGLAAMAGVNPKLPDAVIAQFISERLRPYFDALRKRAAADAVMAGFKFIRPDETGADDDAEADDAEAGAGDSGPDAGAAKLPLFFWFFFPLAGKDIAAWEATSGSGRATYLFRAPAPAADSIARLTRGLALVNFRREPIYLSDEAIERNERFHRYAIGARKLPDLRELRAAYLGRALHTSLDAWQQQLETQAK